MRKSILFVPIALAALACSDQPTSVTSAGAPSYRAAQGDRSEWAYQWVFAGLPADQAWPSGFWSCINGGQGEDVAWWGPDAVFLAKAVVTPSGNTQYNGTYYLLGDGIDHYIGLTSGDEWVSAPFAWEGKTKYTQLANGNWVMQEPGAEIFTNVRTGESVRVLFMWHFHSRDGNNVGLQRNGEAVSCHALPH